MLPERTTTTEPTRSTICPWFDDGNIVLQAENTLFRVHRSVLSLHSSVFRDMFALPPSAEDEKRDMVEGCVVVHLHDKALDVGYMINALYCSSSPFSDREMARIVRLPVVAAILRLGSKYMIGHLRRTAIDALISVYPTTLEGFDNRDEGPVIHFGTDQTSEFDSPAGVVQLLSEQQVLSALPAALYQLCCLPFITLINPRLSIDNQRTAISAKEKLAAEYATRLNDCLCDYSSCPTPFECEPMKLRTRSDFVDPSFSSSLNDGSFLHWALSPVGVCGHCVSECARKYEEARESLWQRLPAIFGIPDWDAARSIDVASCS